MSPNDIPYVHPSRQDREWLVWQARFQREICAMFGLSAEEIYGAQHGQQANLERTFHGAGASDSEAK